MKKTLIVVLALLSFSFRSDGPYKDGTYIGLSRSIYTDEPYYGYVTLHIDNGEIVKAVFFIRDSSKQELFDEKYEKYFAGHDIYIEQCRNDCRGIRAYPDSLIKYQDIEKVDAISGATWSCNIFKASVKEALLKAEKTK